MCTDKAGTACDYVIHIKIMLILPKQIQLCNQTFAYLKEIHYLCSQIKFALLGLGCPRSEKGCHRQLFFITPLERLSCHTSCHPPDRYSFSRHRMPSSHHWGSTHSFPIHPIGTPVQQLVVIVQQRLVFFLAASFNHYS